MSGNRNLNVAALERFDEFYTQKSDIENELRHYKHYFKDKVVFCNCDDPYESEFFKYFASRFNLLGLKKLISSSYAGSPIAQTELTLTGTPNEIANFDRHKDALKAAMNEFKDWNGDDREDLLDVEYFLRNHNGAIAKLSGDRNYPAGDFRSEECIELLKQADVVVTNPPFSLFREYVAQLMKYEKKFLILGNKNAITYTEILPLFIQNKIWIGHTPMSKEVYFNVPQSFINKGLAQNKNRTIVLVNGKYMARSPAIWFTNIDIKKRHQSIPLVFSYYEDTNKYPHYDDYDAIEVSKVVEIPKDYYGVMGVPISFLDKYNPDQFEILGKIDAGPINEFNLANPIINGKSKYKRIAIRRKVVN